MGETVEQMITEFEGVLRQHLVDHELHPRFVPAAREAIVHAEDGDWGHGITLPNGAVRSVQDVVTGLKLAKFISYPED